MLFLVCMCGLWACVCAMCSWFVSVPVFLRQYSVICCFVAKQMKICHILHKYVNKFQQQKNNCKSKSSVSHTHEKKRKIMDKLKFHLWSGSSLIWSLLIWTSVWEWYEIANDRIKIQRCIENVHFQFNVNQNSVQDRFIYILIIGYLVLCRR